MGKKCIICDEEAIFKIKDTSGYYCQDCAEENFADTTILVKVEEEAQRLKEYIEQKKYTLRGHGDIGRRKRRTRGAMHHAGNLKSSLEIT